MKWTFYLLKKLKNWILILLQLVFVRNQETKNILIAYQKRFCKLLETTKFKLFLIFGMSLEITMFELFVILDQKYYLA